MVKVVTMIFEEGDGTDSATIRSIQVDKPLELEFDIGNLLASDPNELLTQKLKSKNPDKYLQSLARDNTQLLINEIWKLPFERVDDVIVTRLPKPTYLVPREKPVPKPKTLTKWEAYSKEKGITKRNKTKKVWDEIVNDWVPRFGYKKNVADREKDWVLEVPKNVDPYEDQFEKKSENKSERIAKNELQRLKNIARTRKVQVPSTGLIPTERPTKTELHESMHVAKKATASLGKFQPKLPNEKPLKNTGKKRKFESVTQKNGIEKTQNMDVLDKILNKKPLLNVEKVVNRGMHREKFDQSIQGPEETKGSEGGDRRRGGRGGEKKKGAQQQQTFQKNSKIKKGSVRKGSFKKGRSKPKSGPKRKKH